MMQAKGDRIFVAVALLLCLTPAARAVEPSPRIVAHRGLLKVAPENVLPNFRACLELRLGFEFDVRRSRDGHLVCVHDTTVNRTSNGQGNVSDLTLAELRALDAGRWFDPAFAGATVPTIDEVFSLLESYRESDVLIAVDLKADLVAADVVALAQKHRVLERLVFIGTTISDRAVRRDLKSASPRARTATVANTSEEFATALAAPDSDWVYLRFRPTRDQVNQVHQAGRRLFLAGAFLNSPQPEVWEEARQFGIDAILTDYPFELRAALNRPQTSRP